MTASHEQERSERLALVEARTNTYAYLSQAYLKEPSEELVNGFLDEGLVSSLPDRLEDGSEHPLRRFAKAYDGDLEALGQEFEALFIVPIRGMYVTPYASVYLTGIMSQEPMRATRQIYKDAGLELGQGSADSPDHIGMELEFMAMLCDRETTVLRDGPSDEVQDLLVLQQRFLTGHLLPWIPQLSSEIIKRGTSDFYGGISVFMMDFVFLDRRLVDELLGNKED